MRAAFRSSVSFIFVPRGRAPLVSAKNRNLCPLLDSRTSRHSAHAQSQVWQIMSCSGLNLLCLQSHSKQGSSWRRPEVAILGADQKERGLWGRECVFLFSHWGCKTFCLLLANLMDNSMDNLMITSSSSLTYWLLCRPNRPWRALVFRPLLTSSLWTKIGTIYD